MNLAIAAVACSVACGGSQNHAGDASTQHQDAGAVGRDASAGVDASAGASPGTLSAMGTLNGQLLPSMNAVMQLSTTNTPPGGVSSIRIHALGMGTVCTELQQNSRYGNSWVASVGVDLDCTGTPPSVPPGSYTVGMRTGMPLPGCTASAYGDVGFYDAQCTLNGAGSMGMLFEASSGTIVLTSVDASSASGTFDLTFPQGNLSGSFSSAPFCSAPFVEAGPPACH
jgi:hypothetical protein